MDGLSSQSWMSKLIRSWSILQSSSVHIHQKIFTISTQLTLLRVALIIPILYTMKHGFWKWSLLLFIVAAITDVLDGWLARILKEQTLLGACLDPIADKLLMISCFAGLALFQNQIPIPFYFVYLIVAKETLLVASAAYYLYVHKTIEVKPTYLGKGSTFFQVLFVLWFFACYFFGWHPLKTSYFFLILLAILIICSLMDYIIRGIKTLGTPK